MIKTNAQKTLQHINNSSRVLIVSHANPDGDTLGSALALSHYCDLQNVANDLLCADAPAHYFSYLPKINHYHTSLSTINIKHYDTIVCVDHGSLNQSRFQDHLQGIINDTNAATVINIDHHASNDSFGNLNHIVTETSSACELLYDMFNECNVVIEKNIATCLMTGIITDTGNFTNRATKQSSLHAASDLVSKGAKIPEISNYVVKNKSIQSLNLWGQIFSRLTINKKYNIAYTVIKEEDFDDNDLNRDAIDGLVNFLSNMEGIRIVMLLIQEKTGLIKGSFRTYRDDTDVAKLASVWDGGGHTKAAGFRIEGNLKEENGKWAVV